MTPPSPSPPSELGWLWLGACLHCALALAKWCSLRPRQGPEPGPGPRPGSTPEARSSGQGLGVEGKGWGQGPQGRGRGRERAIGTFSQSCWSIWICVSICGSSICISSAGQRATPSLCPCASYLATMNFEDEEALRETEEGAMDNEPEEALRDFESAPAMLRQRLCQTSPLLRSHPCQLSLTPSSKSWQNWM